MNQRELYQTLDWVGTDKTSIFYSAPLIQSSSKFQGRLVSSTSAEQQTHLMVNKVERP